jgi:hypothetical protein
MKYVALLNPWIIATLEIIEPAGFSDLRLPACERRKSGFRVSTPTNTDRLTLGAAPHNALVGSLIERRARRVSTRDSGPTIHPPPPKLQAPRPQKHMQHRQKTITPSIALPIVGARVELIEIEIEKREPETKTRNDRDGELLRHQSPQGCRSCHRRQRIGTEAG